jgi:hypothetical protein
MHIPVVLKNGAERLVYKAELQLLISQDRILFFERSDGWVVIGRDKLRRPGSPHLNEKQLERRSLSKGFLY